MADEHKIIYNIEVNTKNGKIKIDGITKGFEDASIAVKKLGEDTAASSAKSSNAIAGTVNAIKAEISALKSEQNAVATNNKQWLDYQIKISGAEQRLRNLQKTQSKVNLTTKNFSKEQNKASDATGGATAAAMELGRVVSDAPYGIRGMANNITQLVSSLGYQAAATNVATGTTYGYVGAIKAMWAALTGPLGVVFAITAVVSLMDGLFGANKKAEKSTAALSSKLKEFSDILRDNVNVSAGEYIKLMRKKVKVDKAATKAAEREIEIEERLAEIKKERIHDEKIITKNILAKWNKTRLLNNLTKEEIKLNKELEGLYNDTAEASNKLKESKDDLVRSVEGSSNWYDEEISRLEEEQGKVVINTEAYNDLGDAIDKVREKLKELKGDDKEDEELIAGTKAFFDDAITAATEFRDTMLSDSKAYADQTKVIEGLIEARNELTGEGEGKKRPKVEHFDIKGIKEGQGKVLNEVIKLNDKMLLASLKDKKSRLIVQRDFHIARLAAIHGDNSEIVQTYKKYYRQLIDTVEQGELELLAKESAKGMGGAPRDKNKDADAILTARLEKMQDFANRFNEISASVTNFMGGEFDRQMTMEQNKTNAINNELRERLNNENLSAGERKNIQLQIARNDEELRKKQEKIEKKRFRMNKAAQIAGALVNTAAAAAGVMKDAEGGFFARLAQAIPTIAFGLGQVAIIARQKFQSSAGATVPAGALGSGGSGSGTGDRSFDFNLAGASRENQLAQTLQGRFDQPLQAYVVSRDITNQQQLDEDIRNNASFG